MSDITMEFARRDDCLDRMVPSDLRQLISERDQLLAQLAQAEARADACQQQAEIWKQEARTQTATVNEVYQLLTGGTGEPGNWNGARPVRSAALRLQAEAVEKITNWSPDGESASGNDLVAMDHIWDYAQRLRDQADEIEGGV